MTRLLTFLLSLLLPTLVLAATLLPNGKQVFLDQNGKPLAYGTVTFYIPNTTTPKQTWKDPGQTILNTNPVVLDGFGSAIIYGSGSYREVVQDANGNMIWDQLTADTSSSQQSWAGTSTGSGNNQVLTAAAFTSSDGQSIWFRAGATNTGPLSVTVNGILFGVYIDTFSGPQALSGGEVITNNVAGLVYDATLGAFHIVNPQDIEATLFSITAAATVDLGTAPSQLVSVTGSATISSFGSSASIRDALYTVLFPAGSTLTASSSLILPITGTSLPLAVNSSLTTVYKGSGIWQVLSVSQGDGSSGVPSGAVMAFNLAACPNGWSQADGTHVALDMRGYFVRGLDTGGVVDPGRTLASFQADAVQQHTHGAAAGAFIVSAAGSAYDFLSGAGVQTYVSTATGGMVTGNSASETRPKNVALLYCVKN